MDTALVKKPEIGLLNETAIFGGIKSEIIQYILDNANIVEKQENECFFYENDIAENMYVLLSGDVDIVKNRKGKQFHIATLRRGDCFGEMAIIDHSPRSATIICHSTSRAIEIDINFFNEIYHKDIKQFALLQMNMGREVCRRLREANELLFKIRAETISRSSDLT